jgi:feruloyl-CoA synthase
MTTTIGMVPTTFAPPEARISYRPDSSFIIRSVQDLEPFGRCIGDYLIHWATYTPERVYLAERAGEDWRRLTYAQVLDQVLALGQALIERGLSYRRPLVILSDNSVNHALLALAAMHAGIPVVPVSPAYSLLSQDHDKLRSVVTQTRPGLVYAEDGAQFARAFDTIRRLEGVGRVDLVAGQAPGTGVEDIATLLATRPGREIDDAFWAARPDTVAKILFTSGSTGFPKGVINTQRMLCANQQSIAQLWPFLTERPPVLVDWLPWNHTFGGNHNFNMVLRHGGTLYIDGGKPTEALADVTLRNLRDVSPTLYFNVPRGYDMLVPALDAEPDLRTSFFRRLELMFYAGAALPQHLWERLETLSISARGARVPLCSSWGSTETGPMVTSIHFDVRRSGIIGLPGPGCEVKFVPNGAKLEMRVRGASVTPGYLGRDDLTRDAFDEEGFYLIGDAGRLADPADPSKGIIFDGRVAENFKLMSGTWVHVGTLRPTVLTACAPLVSDAVITGHDREEVGMLAFASRPGCLALCPDAAPDTPLSTLIARPEVREHLARGLAALAEASTGSSTLVTRALLMAEPPSIDGGEITDKGYINQRAVLGRRAALVDRLYHETLDPEVIVLPDTKRI